MDCLELNVPAKRAYEAFKKRERLTQMRRWRKHEKMSFNNEKSFKEWLDFTGWHKRPIKILEQEWIFTVQFLDWKPKK